MDYLSNIQRAADEIERSLRAPLSISEIARKAGFSYWHFQRLFAALVGEPVGFYIRRRRLTLAAAELRATRRRILDVALDFQFESHESFTRAFRTLFQISPSVYRRHQHFILGRTRPRLTPEKLKHLALHAAMKPQILRLPALTLIGPEAHFISALSPDANNLQVIPPLWHELMARKAELGKPRDTYMYGACRCLPSNQRSREDELAYLAGLNVAPSARAPKGMGLWKIAAGTYAQFTHRGPISKLSETINYVHGAWLPRSGYDYNSKGVELERYDDRFNPEGKNSEMDYLIAVKKK